MLIRFFFELRQEQLPVSITAFLALSRALAARLVSMQMDDFYYLARTSLIKDENLYDKLDRVFGRHFKGLEDIVQEIFGEIPEGWLAKQAEKLLPEEEKRKIQGLGGWGKLM